MQALSVLNFTCILQYLIKSTAILHERLMKWVLFRTSQNLSSKIFEQLLFLRIPRAARANCGN